MTEVSVQCQDCQKTISDTFDMAQYWDWSNNYNPRKHVVCQACYNAAKEAETQANQRR
jgi:hypothetical protein